MKIRLFLMPLLLVSIALVAVLAGCNAGQNGSGQQPQSSSNPSPQPAPGDFFKGKTITFIVPYSPGGGYDTSARTLAPYIEKTTGASVVVQNVPGAGALTGMNTLWASEPDGLTIGMVTGPGAITNQLAGQGVKFDLKKFTWLGGISPGPFTVAVGKDSKYQTIEDVIKTEEPFKVGITGKGNIMTIATALLAKALDFPVKYIPGYPGSSEIFLGITRGDLDGVVVTSDSILKQVDAGNVRPILYVDMKKGEIFPDIPSFGDIQVSQEKMVYVKALINFTMPGRLVAAPPDLPQERAKFLEEAVWTALNDQEFIAAAKKAKVDVGPIPAKDLVSTIQEAMDVPPEIVDLVKNAFE